MLDLGSNIEMTTVKQYLCTCFFILTHQSITDLCILASACTVIAQWTALMARRTCHRCVCMPPSPLVRSPCWEHDTGSSVIFYDVISLVDISDLKISSVLLMSASAVLCLKCHYMDCGGLLHHAPNWYGCWWLKDGLSVVGPMASVRFTLCTKITKFTMEIWVYFIRLKTFVSLLNAKVMFTLGRKILRSQFCINFNVFFKCCKL